MKFRFTSVQFGYMAWQPIAFHSESVQRTRFAIVCVCWCWCVLNGKPPVY